MKARYTPSNHLASLPNGTRCKSCACRRGTEASQSAETLAAFAECVRTGEPFYCHESVAVRDPAGLSADRHGNRYRRLPESVWRVCRGWVTARNKLSGVAVPDTVHAATKGEHDAE